MDKRKELSVLKDDYGISETVINQLKALGLAWDNDGKVWKYPSMGDSQRTCKMLDVMFKIEHGPGIIIFLPYEKN